MARKLFGPNGALGALGALIQRSLLALLISTVALQLSFATLVLMQSLGPLPSTAFQRSEIWRLLRAPAPLRWRHEVLDAKALPNTLRRAVVASEDAKFFEHHGVDWEALDGAWSKNQRAQARAERAAQKSPKAAPSQAAKPPKIVGGSTISQQLAKNLFLSPERSLPRKAQELVLTLMLEAALSKPQLLNLYLNQVEWGEGIFGAEAAARSYFGLPASQLSTLQAARLAVMLPAPKRFQRQPGPYLAARSATVAARSQDVLLP